MLRISLIILALSWYFPEFIGNAQSTSDFLLLGEDHLNVSCEGQRLRTERKSATHVELTCVAPQTPVGDDGAQDKSAACWPNVVPAAALPLQSPPVFCLISNNAETQTVQRSQNQWVDDFEHGESFADFLNMPYAVFDEVDGIHDSIHWRHANHWMVDIAPNAPGAQWGTASGGAMLRPNQAFQFQDGTLVVETEFAAGHQDYSSLRAWGEIVVTTAPVPGGYRAGGTYAYEMFPESDTLGCRLQADRHTICSLMDNTSNSALHGGRTWEMSFFQHVGDTVYGGEPSGDRGNYFRVCQADADPDTTCRDRFRMELTKTSLTLYVNGVLYFQQQGIPPLPDSLVNGDVYVYFASIAGHSDHDVIRFHWDRIAVNP